jgi:monovalent cation:H+ antiporter-2, CPA2 family
VVEGHFLENLAIVLCAAAITTIVFQRLRQPVVLGYLIAGIIVGPHFPLVPIVVDKHTVETLSELGVILLMFSLGLEFNLAKLARVAKTGGLIALIEVSLMLSIGYLIGRALGWGPQASIFAGAVISISSTTIIAKTFAEQKTDKSTTERVFGILVAEDLLAILLVTSLTAISTGAGLSAEMLFVTVGQLVLFLVTVVVLGMFVIPRLMRLVVKLNRPETTVVASVGLCFALAIFARTVGYSVALGAFLAGSLVSESGRTRTIEHLVQPLRDVFAAVFFVSVGMLIDPVVAIREWPAILLFTAVVIGGKVLAVGIGSFLSGASIRQAIQSGMTLAQIGEFSFIIASVGLALKATNASLYPVAVVVSALTTLTTPWLVRASEPFGAFVERHTPRRIQVFATLYSSWLERVKQVPEQEGLWPGVRRIAKLILLDVALLIGLVIATSLLFDRASHWLAETFNIHLSITQALVVAASLVAAGPFLVGSVRLVRSLGQLIAQEARSTGGEAPRALLVAVQIGIVLIIGAPFLALTSAFLPATVGLVVLGGIVAFLAFVFWRSANELQTQVRAGVHVVMDMLAKQSATDESGDLEHAVHSAMPWFGSIQSITIAERSEAVGRTLAEINLRGRTGANVVAIRRSNEVLVPAADEALRAGDILAITGSPHAVRAAELVVSAPGSASDSQTEMAIKRV